MAAHVIGRRHVAASVSIGMPPCCKASRLKCEASKRMLRAAVCVLSTQTRVFFHRVQLLFKYLIILKSVLPLSQTQSRSILLAYRNHLFLCFCNRACSPVCGYVVEMSNEMSLDFTDHCRQYAVLWNSLNKEYKDNRKERDFPTLLAETCCSSLSYLSNGKN